jgi:hypothetical protein
LTLTNSGLKPLVYDLQTVLGDLNLRKVVVHHGRLGGVEKFGLADDLCEDL